MHNYARGRRQVEIQNPGCLDDELGLPDLHEYRRCQVLGLGIWTQVPLNK